MMAFVSYTDPTDGSEFVCSGTVLSPNVVLTAAHCAEDTTTGVLYQPSGFAIATGSLDWTDTSVRQVSGVSRTAVDPDFTPSTLDGDAALLILSTPTAAPPIPLPADPADLQLLTPGTAADIAGWGQTATESIATQLQWGTTVVQRVTYCAARASAAGAAFDPGRQICTIDPPTFADGTCAGDSGGPLLARRTNGTWVEIGLTNSGPSDCGTTAPDFFTRADSFTNWAESWIHAVGTAASGSSSAPTAPATTPLPGPYQGRTSQHLPITLNVAPSGTSISSVAITFRLRCTRRRPPTYRIKTTGWRLRNDGMEFDHAFRDTAGEHYDLRGSLDTSGHATGFLTTTWHTRRYGSCRSGEVEWDANATP